MWSYILGNYLQQKKKYESFLSRVGFFGAFIFWKLEWEQGRNGKPGVTCSVDDQIAAVRMVRALRSEMGPFLGL